MSRWNSFIIKNKNIYGTKMKIQYWITIGKFLNWILNKNGRKNVMLREEIFEKLNILFRNNFNNQEINLTNETSDKDIEEWDSIEHIDLIVAIEDMFHIKFNIAEVNSMKNVGKMVDFIIQKIEE